jgi:hypothetical protein
MCSTRAIRQCGNFRRKVAFSALMPRADAELNSEFRFP